MYLRGEFLAPYRTSPKAEEKTKERLPSALSFAMDIFCFLYCC